MTRPHLRIVRNPPELEREVADLDLWLNRQRNAPEPGTLRDLWDCIRGEPGSHLFVGVLGFIAGSGGILGLAYLYAEFVL